MTESWFVKKNKNQYVKMMDVPIYHAKFGPLKKKNKNFTGLVSSNEVSFGIFYLFNNVVSYW